MRILMSALALSVVALGLTGCDDVVETPNGEIPAEYVQQAQAYMGDYAGNFEGQHGTLHLSITGNTPVLEFVSTDGSNDLVGEGCSSAIGQLVSVALTKKNNQPAVADATFAFNPANCVSIQGRTVNLHFSHNRDGSPKKVSVTVYAYTTWHWRPGYCHGDRYGTICEPGQNERQDVYLYGSFRKQ